MMSEAEIIEIQRLAFKVLTDFMDLQTRVLELSDQVDRLAEYIRARDLKDAADSAVVQRPMAASGGAS